MFWFVILSETKNLHPINKRRCFTRVQHDKKGKCIINCY